LELANCQRAETTEAVPQWDGFGIDDVTVRESMANFGDDEHGPV
jgi:hypothetical protein